jgi:hypothetical protein
MTVWTTDELSRIENADELQISPRGKGGALPAPVTVWVVRNGDDVFVRSYRGENGRWYRGTQARHEGHVSAGGVDKEVSFVDVTDSDTNAQVDGAYRAKYHRYGETMVGPMLAAAARATTLRLVPR